MSGWDEFWMSDDAYEAEREIQLALPVVLAGEDPTPESADEAFSQMVSGLSASEAASFGSALRQIGRWANDNQVKQIAGAVLPIAGTAVGTIYGGPAGAALGQTIGQRAGQAISGGSQKVSGAPTASPPAAPSPAPQGAEPSFATGDGSQAASKLLYLVQNPAFLSSLVALALGSRGQPTLAVGDDQKPVRVGAFINLANDLISKTAQDADAFTSDGDAEAFSYLKDERGSFICDPAVPSQRAEVLLGLLQKQDESLWRSDDEIVPPDGEDEIEEWDAAGWDDDEWDDLSEAWDNEW